MQECTKSCLFAWRQNAMFVKGTTTTNERTKKRLCLKQQHSLTISRLEINGIFRSSMERQRKKNTCNVNLRLNFYTGKLKINASDVIHNPIVFSIQSMRWKRFTTNQFMEIIPMKIDIIINKPQIYLRYKMASIWWGLWWV